MRRPSARVTGRRWVSPGGAARRQCCRRRPASSPALPQRRRRWRGTARSCAAGTWTCPPRAPPPGRGTNRTRCAATYRSGRVDGYPCFAPCGPRRIGPCRASIGWPTVGGSRPAAPAVGPMSTIVARRVEWRQRGDQAAVAEVVARSAPRRPSRPTWMASRTSLPQAARQGRPREQGRPGSGTASVRTSRHWPPPWSRPGASGHVAGLASNPGVAGGTAIPHTGCRGRVDTRHDTPVRTPSPPLTWSFIATSKDTPRRRVAGLRPVQTGPRVTTTSSTYSGVVLHRLWSVLHMEARVVPTPSTGPPTAS